MNVAVERRTAPEGGLAKKLAWPLRLSRANACQLIALCGVLAACADLFTSSQIWFGPIYLLIIALAAWSLGWLEAIAVGLVCLAFTLSANGSELYPYAGAAGAWNILVRVAAVLVLVALLHTVRQMYAREWWVSRTDPLTGALNRKAFFELTTARTSSRGWSMLVYVDLDGFKALNDRSGHAAGDACLAVFAQRITRVIRTSDVFARVGGDEFVIYLDVRDQSAAKAVAVRLHRAMNAAMQAEGTSVQCSMGAIILAPGRRSIDAEIRSADSLMYEAKELRSSLVVGTADQRGSRLMITRHWELTPQGADSEDSAVPDLSRQRQSVGPARSRQPQVVKVA
jgi:diguanylate cyclase (GGDEF)-like protein